MSKSDKIKFCKVMDGYKITESFISELHVWGLRVIKTHKHVKVMRLDGIGGVVILSSTPSDHRSGKNAASLLIRLIEA